MAVKRTAQPRLQKRSARSPSNTHPRQSGRPLAGRSPPQPANSGLPSIIIDDRQLSDLTAQALAAVKRANSLRLHSCVLDVWFALFMTNKTFPRLNHLMLLAFAVVLTEVANFFTLRKSDGGYIQVAPIRRRRSPRISWLKRIGSYHL